MAAGKGYTKVMVFAAGYPAWKEKFGGGTTVAAAPAKAAPAAKHKLKPGKEEGSIDHQVFLDLVKAGAKDIMLIDVRDANEYAKGSLPGSVNIPTDQLEKKLPQMKVDKPIVFVCSTGARSGEAYYMVLDLRPDVKEVYYVDGELSYDGKGGYSLKPAK